MPTVTIRDLAGDGDHYAATVLAESFRGKSRVQQHQLVYNALKGQMGGALHALALQTGLPERLRSRNMTAKVSPNGVRTLSPRGPSLRPAPGASERAPAISSSSPGCAASIRKQLSGTGR